jgi:peptidyl-dipeptidase A
METVYNSAKICPFTNQDCDVTKDEAWTLDPEIVNIMATSTNYEELEYVWKAWRDASGKNMREDYKAYVDIVNAAAKLNGKLLDLVRIPWIY